MSFEVAIRKTLIEYAIDSVENQALHSWRCRYPESYGGGPCNCFDNLVKDLNEACMAEEWKGRLP